MTRALPATARAAAAPPDLCYLAPDTPLPSTLLGAVVYGRDARARCQRGGDDRLVGVALDTIPGDAVIEAWTTRGEVSCGARAGVSYSASAEHFFGVIEIDERSSGGLRAAGREAYERLVRFHAAADYAYVWRIWNFLDAINEGAGDAERYRLFCQGRAEGLGQPLRGYPAASALGRRDGERLLQVIWLAGREPGNAIENPRQVSAFRYPRRYGPSAPTFSRAMHLHDELMISGTASIVGHETVHAGDVRAQVREAVANLHAVTSAAATRSGAVTRVKAYVRHADDVPAVEDELRRCCPLEPSCVLLADVCRDDLLVELEAVGVLGAASLRP